MQNPTKEIVHKPVLLKEVLELFDPKPGENYIDATINGGGHARAIAKLIGPRGKVLGIDWDCDLVEKLEAENRELGIYNIIADCDNYVNLENIIIKHNFYKVRGILFDLGFSSYHIEESGRGFSFLKNEPLDMRYDHLSHEKNAADIINNWPEEAIVNLLRNYGEERYARNIARGICHARRQKKITTTGQLLEIIKRNLPRRLLEGRINPATKTFQALRIAVNQEFENIEQGISRAISHLAFGSKVIVISFHSLEDRIVKNFLRTKKRAGILKIITPKPVMATLDERRANPRSRSAKLRAAEIL